MPVTDLDAAISAASAGRGGGSPEDKRAYVRSVFSAIAPRYDLLNHLLSLNIDRAWRRAALRELGWERRPKGLYLDVCAGTLDVAAMLAATTGFAGRVLGADFAEPMLRAGKGKAPATVVSPVVSDAVQLPLADDSIDGATVAFGIRNVADLDAGLREIRRVLSPGSRFVILEFTTPRSRIVRGLYHLYFHRILPKIGGLISGHPTAYTYLPKSVSNFPIEEALAERMRRAGFTSVRWRVLSFGIAAIHVGEKGE